MKILWGGKKKTKNGEYAIANGELSKCAKYNFRIGPHFNFVL